MTSVDLGVRGRGHRTSALGVRLAAAAWLSVALAGCMGELDDPQAYVDGAVCPTDMQADFFTKKCGLAGCHVAYNPPGGLDLVSPDLGQRLLGRASSTCAGREIIDPAHPEQSFLLERLSPSPRCGDLPVERMPFTGDYLSEAEMACVEDWVGRVVAGGGHAR